MAKSEQKDKTKVQWKPEIYPLESKEMKEANKFLSHLIQINTTNTDEDETGNELEAAEYCKEYLQKEGFEDIKIFESAPTRGSMICRWKGTDQPPNEKAALCLLGHLDVVPADEEKWDENPFGGKITDKYIWGRGAIDCKGLVASELMAAVLLKQSGYRPKKDIILAFTADEEVGGDFGLEFLAEKHWEKIEAELTINEGGGILLPIGPEPKDYIVQVGEKGVFWTKIRVQGEGGHGSMPVNKKNSAMYKIAKITQKIIDYKPPIEIPPTVERMVEAISLPGIAKKIMLQKWLIRPIMKLVKPFLGNSIPKLVLPLISDVLTPTGLKASEKVNIVPQSTEMTFDCRLLPGHDRETVKIHLKRAVGRKLFNQLEIIPLPPTQPATVNKTQPELWKKVNNIISVMHEGANLVPMLSAGSTDSKYIREKGGYALGFCPMRMDPNMDYAEMNEMIHGKNERMWIPNYAYAIEFFTRLIRTI